MALNRDKFRNIVGGITTPKNADDVQPVPAPPPPPPAPSELPAVGQGSAPDPGNGSTASANSDERRRFAKRGRPRASQTSASVTKGPKVKVSLFLSEELVNDLYDWAHDDRVHPGEMFDRALRAFHDKEAKRRNAGKV